MWFLPLLVISAIVVAAASRSPRESAPSRQLALATGPLPPPGPISVLGELVRIGQVPPPTVILCAIAEAEALGCNDLASDIIRVFVAPVVYQHAGLNQRAGYGAPSAAAQPQYATRPQYTRGSCAPSRPSRSPRDEISYGGGFPTTDAEIRAMINSDPEGFIAMATRGMPVMPVIEIPIEAVHQASVHVVMPSQPPLEPVIVHSAPPPVSASPPAVTSPEVVAQVQEDLREAVDQTLALGPGSPLVGVGDGAWREFVTRLEREPATFNSSRHVGQYRQRRERLAELGVDPRTLLGSTQAQRSALDADLVDAHHHAATAGDLSKHVGRSVAVPGREKTETITLSGVLGVIQCAGLDGATGWLESPGDRKKFPHTTQVFLRTNGVF
jgi:hypothetical protein